ncbi:phage antirepressor KilAC domain-containing protein [Bacteroides fragilis]|uniref:phage antirepressor KilAC domain-containing protein n=1 Tax=Bacteroides fragilis TaxID=817 RepID=UPI00217563B1|nr:phage antirepressor KilAC domain-containing protein [Bacteroides fragilis]
MLQTNEIYLYGNNTTVQTASAHETSKTFSYNGNDILFDTKNDVMVNATQLAKIYGKRPNDYLSLPATNQLINAITRKYGIAESQLIRTERGGTAPGTWMHRLIVVDFCQWLDIDLKLWCTEKLDELMRYGMTATQPTLEQMIDNPDLVIHLATQLKREREERAKLEAQTEQQQITIELQEKEIKQAAPKVSYYDNHLQSVNTLTSTQVAKQIGMDAEKLHRKMKEIGILYKQSGQWLLYSPFSTWGLHATRTQTYTRNDGSIGTSVYTVWTTKGLRFIHALNECGWNVKKAIKQIKGEFEPAA